MQKQTSLNKVNKIIKFFKIFILKHSEEYFKITLNSILKAL